MRRTPEGKVKDWVKEIIASYKPHVYSHWPVLNGMGKPTLDCTGCVDGDYFAIETKAPGEVLTMQQARTRHEMEAAGATVFVVDSIDSPAMDEFEAWLHHRVMRRIGKKISSPRKEKA